MHMFKVVSIQRQSAGPSIIKNRKLPTGTGVPVRPVFSVPTVAAAAAPAEPDAQSSGSDSDHLIEASMIWAIKVQRTPDLKKTMDVAYLQDIHFATELAVFAFLNQLNIEVSDQLHDQIVEWLNRLVGFDPAAKTYNIKVLSDFDRKYIQVIRTDGVVSTEAHLKIGDLLLLFQDQSKIELRTSESKKGSYAHDLIRLLRLVQDVESDLANLLKESSGKHGFFRAVRRLTKEHIADQRRRLEAQIRHELLRKKMESGDYTRTATVDPSTRADMALKKGTVSGIAVRALDRYKSRGAAAKESAQFVSENIAVIIAGVLASQNEKMASEYSEQGYSLEQSLRVSELLTSKLAGWEAFEPGQISDAVSMLLGGYHDPEFIFRALGHEAYFALLLPPDFFGSLRKEFGVPDKVRRRDLALIGPTKDARGLFAAIDRHLKAVAKGDSKYGKIDYKLLEALEYIVFGPIDQRLQEKGFDLPYPIIHRILSSQNIKGDFDELAALCKSKFDIDLTREQAAKIKDSKSLNDLFATRVEWAREFLEERLGKDAVTDIKVVEFFGMPEFREWFDDPRVEGFLNTANQLGYEGVCAVNDRMHRAYSEAKQSLFAHDLQPLPKGKFYTPSQTKGHYTQAALDRQRQFFKRAIAELTRVRNWENIEGGLTVKLFKDLLEPLSQAVRKLIKTLLSHREHYMTALQSIRPDLRQRLSNQAALLNSYCNQIMRDPMFLALEHYLGDVVSVMDWKTDGDKQVALDKEREANRAKKINLTDQVDMNPFIQKMQRIKAGPTGFARVPKGSTDVG